MLGSESSLGEGTRKKVCVKVLGVRKELHLLFFLPNAQVWHGFTHVITSIEADSPHESTQRLEGSWNNGPLDPSQRFSSKKDDIVVHTSVNCKGLACSTMGLEQPVLLTTL